MPFTFCRQCVCGSGSRVQCGPHAANRAPNQSFTKLWNVGKNNSQVQGDYTHAALSGRTGSSVVAHFGWQVLLSVSYQSSHRQRAIYMPPKRSLSLPLLL